MSASDVNLSIALMGAAGAVAAATAFGGLSSIFQRPGHLAIPTLICVVLALLTLVASIYFGGRGVAYGPGTGAWNHFDLQAKLGLVGMVFVIGAAIFASAGAIRAHNAAVQQDGNVLARLTEIEQSIADILVRLDGMAQDGRNGGGGQDEPEIPDNPEQEEPE